MPAPASRPGEPGEPGEPGGYAAEDLPPGTPVVVYARLHDPDGQADRVADLIRWCHRRDLAFQSAYADGPAAGLWDVMMQRIWYVGAAAIVVPALNHLGETQVERQARLEAAATAGAVVAIAPEWERLITARRMDGQIFGAFLQTHAIHGGITVRFHVPELPTPPRLLPAPTSAVTRPEVERVVAELDALQPHADSGPLLAVIIGADRAGTSTAALHWLRGRDWPDGDLHADLAMTGGQPVTPGAVLATWLPALGIPAQHVPADLAEQAALYRSLTADKRLGVLLTGAISAAQVRPLIPNGPSAVVITSRRPLSGLVMDGACFLHLGDSVDADPIDP